MAFWKLSSVRTRTPSSIAMRPSSDSALTPRQTEARASSNNLIFWKQENFLTNNDETRRGVGWPHNVSVELLTDKATCDVSQTEMITTVYLATELSTPHIMSLSAWLSLTRCPCTVMFVRLPCPDSLPQPAQLFRGQQPLTHLVIFYLGVQPAPGQNVY